MIVIDIDGVLADARHREHLLRGRRDWPAFFAAAVDDTPIEEGRRLLQDALDRGPVTLLTGRPAWLREATLAWLSDHGFPALPIVMRPDHDRRPAAAFKSEALGGLGGPAQVSLVVDDDPAVVASLRQAGYVVQVFDA